MILACTQTQNCHIFYSTFAKLQFVKKTGETAFALTVCSGHTNVLKNGFMLQFVKILSCNVKLKSFKIATFK
jgi:hypothetical protein